MARRSLWQRVRSAVGRFFGAETPEPSRPQEPPQAPPEPPAPFFPPLPPESEPEDAEDIYRRVPPEESGIPPGPEESDYIRLGRDMGVYHDPFAMDMLWYGWFAQDITPDQRSSARDQFFRYTDMESYDFDWDQWRDWYENVSG